MKTAADTWDWLGPTEPLQGAPRKRGRPKGRKDTRARKPPPRGRAGPKEPYRAVLAPQPGNSTRTVGAAQLAALKSPGAWATVELTTRHSVNGTSYGPGTVRVRENIAKQFRETEQRMQDNERALFSPQAAIIQLGYGGARVIRVSPHLFDQALNSEQFTSTIV